MSQRIPLYLLLSLFFNTLHPAATMPGTLDTTFNNTGTVTTTFNGMYAISNYNPNTGLTIQPDGKIILVGTASNNSNTFFGIGRFNSDGSLDAAGFNPTGTTQPGTGTLPLINNTNSTCYAVALQTDGKIVIAGSASNGSINCFALARLNTDGTLDTTDFNSTATVSNHAGIVVTAAGTASSVAYSIALQSDGKIVAAGSSDIGSGSQGTVVRYNTDGSVDTSFGVNGIARLPLVNSDITQVYSVAIDPTDGAILVGGYGYGTINSYVNFLVARFTPAGVLDTSFVGTNNQSNVPGVVIYVIDSDQYYNYGYALTIQPDRKVVITGYFYDDYGIAIARINRDGDLDTTFNAYGSQPGTAQIFINDSVYNYSGAGAITLQKDGSIIVAGYGYPPQTYEETFSIARIKPNGQMDQTFNPNAVSPGSNMALFHNATGQADASSVAVQSNGAIVMGGFATVNSNNYFALARVNGGGSTTTDPYALLLINNYAGLV